MTKVIHKPVVPQSNLDLVGVRAVLNYGTRRVLYCGQRVGKLDRIGLGQVLFAAV